MRLAAVVACAVAASGWAAWLVAAPALAASAEHGPALWAAAATYRAGAVICHQRGDRSFHVSGVRMPVCARCAGLYAGAALGFVLSAGWMIARRRRAAAGRAPRLTVLRWAVAASAAPTAAAWAAEHLAGTAVHGEIRALAAVPLGAAAAVVVALWVGGVTPDDTPAATGLH
jgi:hypothetical protein